MRSLCMGMLRSRRRCCCYCSVHPARHAGTAHDRCRTWLLSDERCKASQVLDYVSFIYHKGLSSSNGTPRAPMSRLQLRVTGCFVRLTRDTKRREIGAMPDAKRTPSFTIFHSLRPNRHCFIEALHGSSALFVGRESLHAVNLLVCTANACSASSFPGCEQTDRSRN